jgi:hypothetical protein
VKVPVLKIVGWVENPDGAGAPPALSTPSALPTRLTASHYAPAGDDLNDPIPFMCEWR